MTEYRSKALWVLAVVAVSCIGGTWVLAPIAQDQAYHTFADERALFGIPPATLATHARAASSHTLLGARAYEPLVTTLLSDP